MTAIRRCDHWADGYGYCGESAGVRHLLGESAGVRHLLVGWRCPVHTPAVLAGRMDTEPDPARTLDALRAAAGRVAGFNPNDTALTDQRAIASGRRRSSQQAYRDARAAEEQRRERHA